MLSLDYSFGKIDKEGKMLDEPGCSNPHTDIKYYDGKIYFSTQNGEIFLREDHEDKKIYQFDLQQFNSTIKDKFWLKQFEIVKNNLYLALIKSWEDSNEPKRALLLRYDLVEQEGKCLCEDFENIKAFKVINN